LCTTRLLDARAFKRTRTLNAESSRERDKLARYFDIGQQAAVASPRDVSVNAHTLELATDQERRRRIITGLEGQRGAR
jgi:hypothetical protein